MNREQRSAWIAFALLCAMATTTVGLLFFGVILGGGMAWGVKHFLRTRHG